MYFSCFINPFESPSTFYQALGAIGTLLAVVVALFMPLFQDWIRRKWRHPKLIPNIESCSGWLNQENSEVYFHLKIVNQKSTYPARECRVFVCGMFSADEAGSLSHNQKAGFPEQLSWTPWHPNREQTSAPRQLTVRSSAGCDFLIMNSKGFFPAFYHKERMNDFSILHNKDNYLLIKIEAEDFQQDFIFKVRWNGRNPYCNGINKSNDPEIRRLEGDEEDTIRKLAGW